MAGWFFGIAVTVLLMVIICQLRGLGRTLRATSKPGATVDDAGLNGEAWLMELEAKGAELLARIENEKAALNLMAAAAAGRPPEPQDQGGVSAAGGLEEWSGWRSDEMNRYMLQKTVGEMAGSGAHPATIARTLGLGKEEVRLMLRLHGRNEAKKSHPHP